jgi:hypothetical protein
MNNFNYRQLKYQFRKWNYNSKMIKNGRDKLTRFVIDKLLFRCRQAFLKWNNLVIY